MTARDLNDKLKPSAIDLARDRAWDLHMLAQLQELSRKIPEADQSWRQATSQFESLMEKSPKRLDPRSDLAYHLTQQALASARRGHSDGADRQLRRAVEILERVVSHAPERSDDRYRLAWAPDCLGNYLLQNARKRRRADESPGISAL
jgi:hypothetical protein